MMAAFGDRYSIQHAIGRGIDIRIARITRKKNGLDLTDDLSDWSTISTGNIGKCESIELIQI
jgi:hypothetical protein